MRPVDQFQAKAVEEHVHQPGLQPLLALILQPGVVVLQLGEEVPEEDLQGNRRAEGLHVE